MKKILKNPYFITITISTLILILIFLIKGIYPFGDNTLIYGDMYDQITAFYYHFYDIFHGNSSFLVDFTTSGGINFWGIFSYYIASPFSFLLLLFKRENLYLAVSIVVALKAILASITCLCSIRYFSHKKCPGMLAVLLSLSYAFSGYFFHLYQITPWMDAMYLFPILMIGLKKVIERKSPVLYIVTLSLSLILSFYVSSMGLIFILLVSFFYIYFQRRGKERKKSIVSLGISTALAIGISMFVMLPSFMQILASSRLDLSFDSIFRSGIGPIQDKLVYFFSSSFLVVSFIFLLRGGKRYQTFLKWYLPSMVTLFLPYIVEPINRFIHFSSYASFPNRYGYITCYFLVLGSLYYFMNLDVKNQKCNRIVPVLGIFLVTLCVLISSTVFHYEMIQKAISSLSFASGRVFWILLIMFLIACTMVIFIFLFLRNRYQYFFLLLVSLIQIFCSAYLYLGISDGQKTYRETYQVMHDFYTFHQKEDVSRLKNNTSSLITNSGMVMGYPNLDHFTSLVDKNNLHFLKQLGYSSHWTKTYSKNGTLFADSILGNQYYLTKQKLDNEWYQFQVRSGKYNLYKLQEDLSFGYFTKDIDFQKENHTFSLQNKIYRAITGKDQDLFQVFDDFHARNLDITTKEKRTLYKIKDLDAVNYLEIHVPVTEQSILYLEVFNSFQNTDDQTLYEKMRIYVNNQLYKAKYPLVTSNGCLNLGEYQDEDVFVQIEFLDDISLSYIEIGALPVSLMKSFIQEEKVDSNVKYQRNQIVLDISSDKDGLFFIPVPYGEGYRATVNGKDVEVIPLYKHFLGVKLEKGDNHVEFTYGPPGFKIGTMMSAISFLLAIFFIRFYEKIISNRMFGFILEYLYIGISAFLLFFVYFVSFVCFILSYFFYIY